jgi:hypothetical protein
MIYDIVNPRTASTATATGRTKMFAVGLLVKVPKRLAGRACFSSMGSSSEENAVVKTS